MLYDIEPDRTVTGGTWYSGQEFDSEFIDVLTQQCYKYLQHAVRYNLYYTDYFLGVCVFTVDYI